MEEEQFLGHIITALEEASDLLDEAYNKNNSHTFNKAKKLILKIQDELVEMLV